ncbi:hypothetical protein [Amycolatopsis sp. NPDC003731]
MRAWHTPLAVLTGRRWNLAVIPRTVLAKLEDRHPDGIERGARP